LGYVYLHGALWGILYFLSGQWVAGAIPLPYAVISSVMESHGVAGATQITGAIHELIKDDFVCEPCGTVHIKGKGDMDVWLVRRQKN
jgi:hypothetical protein